jgi:hypothetical protein
MPKTCKEFFAYPIKKANAVAGCGGCHPEKGSGSDTDPALPRRGCRLRTGWRRIFEKGWRFTELILLTASVSPLFFPRLVFGQQTGEPPIIRTVVNLPTDELNRIYPELKHLDLTQGEIELSQLLTNVGNQVEVLFRDFPNTSSRERIRMEILDANGRPIYALTKDFQYLLVAEIPPPEKEREGSNPAVILSPNSPRVKVNEYRTDSKGSEVDALKLEGSFLTRGYETVPLFFHPYYRDGSVFRYLGRETAGAKNYVIAFAQIPDKARLRGKIDSFGISFGFFLQGFVWVDPTTYQILRMRTDLLLPLFEAGLTRQTTVIDLANVRFDETGQALWLPHEVIVYSTFMGLNYRNRHQYSQYRLFTVEAKEGNKQIVVPAKPNHPNR